RPGMNQLLWVTTSSLRFPLSLKAVGEKYIRGQASISRLQFRGRHAARQAKAADLRRVVGRARLVVIADVPESAVIGRIHRESGVVLPAVAVCLRSRAVRQDGFGEGQLSRRIARHARRKPLAWVI